MQAILPSHTSDMSLVDDRLIAIGRIEESVYGGLEEGRRPKLLAETLFGLLRQAVEHNGLIGAQLSLATAAKNLDTTRTSTTFKKAIDRIAEELQHCREGVEIPRVEDRPGVACVEADLEGIPHLVIVRGPRSAHRGDPHDQLLRLKVEFRPIAAVETLPVATERDGRTSAEHTPPSTAMNPREEERLTTARPSVRFISVGAVAIFVIIAIAAGYLTLRRQPSEHRVFVLDIPAETSRYYDAYGGRISPDGSRIAFLARAQPSGKRLIFVREIDKENADPIEENVSDFTSFFWSHDSKSLYFTTGEFLKRKRVGQQAVQTIAPLDGAPRGTVNRAGVVLLSSSKGIAQLLPNGRTTLITVASDKESAHTAPYFLPDDVSFLFIAISHGRHGGTVKTLCSGRIDAPFRIRRIGPISSRVEWNAGYLLYARDGALYARPWSLDKESFAGNEVRVTQHVWSKAGTSDADFSVARNGLLIVKDAASRSRFESVRSGTNSIPIPWQGQVVGITVARDRDLAVLASQLTPGRTDLWAWDLKGDARRQLTSFGTNTSPVLTATGEDVYYAADRTNFASIYRMSIATGAETPVLSGGGPRGISSDGELLLYASNRAGDSDLFCINLKTRRVIAIANSPKAREGETGRFSPDGKQVVYVSDVSGEQRVYVAPFPPDEAAARPISVGGGWRARWSNDGKKIYYLRRRALIEYDVPTGVERELYRADSDISHMEPTGRGDFLVVIAPVEPANRIYSNWQDVVGKDE